MEPGGQHAAPPAPRRRRCGSSAALSSPANRCLPRVPGVPACRAPLTLPPLPGPAGDGGVIKTVVAEGSGWAKPLARDDVTVRFSARVQGAAQPFYTTPEGGKEFSLEQGSPFCRAIGVGEQRRTGEAGGAAGLGSSTQGCWALPGSRGRCGPEPSRAASPPPLFLFLAAAAATMKKGEEAKLVVKPECEWAACRTARGRPRRKPNQGVQQGYQRRPALLPASPLPPLTLWIRRTAHPCRWLWRGGTGRRGAAGRHPGD